MAAKYTSFRIVIDKILRDSLFNGLNYEAAVDYCIDFINIFYLFKANGDLIIDVI